MSRSYLSEKITACSDSGGTREEPEFAPGHGGVCGWRWPQGEGGRGLVGVVSEGSRRTERVDEVERHLCGVKVTCSGGGVSGGVGEIKG